MNSVSDPWVITQRDKLRYQEQFKALQPQNGYITGLQAKGFFLQSQLPPLILGQIWGLADIDSDGKMNITEFSIACKLISLKMRGMEVPKALPPTLLDSLDIVNTTPTGALSPLDPVKNIAVTTKTNNQPNAIVAQSPQTVAAVLPIASEHTTPIGTQPNTTSGVILAPGSTTLLNSVVMPVAQPVAPVAIVMPNMANVAPQPSMVPPNAIVPTVMPLAGSTSNNSIAAAKTVQPHVAAPIEIKGSSISSTPPQSNASSRHTSISERPPSLESPQSEWAVKTQAKRKYSQVFNAADRHRTGYLTGVQARSILVQSKLPQATLAQIWTLSDLDCDGRLSCDEFILAMFLCDKAMNGEKIPTTLPADWIPPSFRKSNSRHGSVSGIGSRSGSQPSSRHASVSSQGALDSDPAAGLPQTSFEDKRKENFDKGQAELERRRKLLEEQQRKEKEERERKEREEAEKKERARLEAERKQQEELERQLQKQRELELEKEEQRKRDLEAKEAARKELEKQRLQEWEQARIVELNSQKQREQERVLKQKASNTQHSIELSTLNEKIKSLSQKICETRADVTNVKSIIDGMRSERDTFVTELSHLKARIKDQNTRLLQLAQERSKWDAKVKATGPLGDGVQQEQLSAVVAHKQLMIKQLKDKVENTANEIESKKEDIKSHNLEVTEAKAELANLINKCEELYSDYDAIRNKVLEMKFNKKNESAVITSAWDTDASWASAPTSATIDNYSAVNDSTITIPMTQSVINANAQDTSSEQVPEGFVKYRAIYEFIARNADEISFVPGDIILVPIEQNAEPGWLAGEINGHTGWFPETYVEKLDETIVSVQTYLSQDAFNDNTTDYNDLKGLSDTSFKDEMEYYIATYPYESEEVGDLTFSAGEMIMVTKKEGDWWTGIIGKRSGMFPSNYVQKADVGSTAINAEQIDLDDKKKDIATYNDNTQNIEFSTITTTTAAVAIDIVEQEKQVLKHDANSSAAVVSTQLDSEATAEEKRTNEELDTEVSQINTTATEKTQPSTEQSESYSRPMSRTSSMTPGMRAKRSEIAQVIAPYEATSSEQLSLTRGQLIMIRKKTDSGWWEGELQAKGRRRQIGWFPATYVKVLQGGRNSGRNTPVSGSRVEMAEQIIDKVIALYPYKALNDDELSFEKDDIISVLGRDEPEWWRGELNGLTGLFPSNYVGPFVTSGNV